MPTWRLGDHGKGGALGQHVDQRRLAHVGPPNDGKFGVGGGGALVHRHTAFHKGGRLDAGVGCRTNCADFQWCLSVSNSLLRHAELGRWALVLIFLGVESAGRVELLHGVVADIGVTSWKSNTTVPGMSVDADEVYQAKLHGLGTCSDLCTWIAHRRKAPTRDTQTTI